MVIIVQVVWLFGSTFQCLCDTFVWRSFDDHN